VPSASLGGAADPGICYIITAWLTEVLRQVSARSKPSDCQLEWVARAVWPLLLPLQSVSAPTLSVRGALRENPRPRCLRPFVQPNPVQERNVVLWRADQRRLAQRAEGVVEHGKEVANLNGAEIVSLDLGS
jgi:hypothetical protein